MVPTADLLTALVNRGDDSPYCGLVGPGIENNDTRAPASRLAKMLKPFGVAPQQHWASGRKTRGYLRSDLEPIWERSRSHTVPLDP